MAAREEETRLSGARGDFVAGLGRRVEALRAALRALEQAPSDAAQRNGLLRRVHALASSARVLGFASVAEAVTEAEQRLRRGEFVEVARALDLLPSLVLGVPLSRRPAGAVGTGRVRSWPLSVLVFGASALADAIRAIPETHVECERTEDVTRAIEQARLSGPDLAVIDADRPGARDLVEAFAQDPSIAPVPVVVVGDFATPEAASGFIALGAARALPKPVSPEVLQRTVVELRAQAIEARVGREPLGELSVEGLAERIASEVRRGLLEAVEPSTRGVSVAFGDGVDVMAAVWGAVARVRELVTLRSSGAVRFDSSGPEGAVPFAAWGNEERRAGERGASADDARRAGVSLQGRRIVVADDDPAVVWFMSGLLKAMGVEVLEAHDGARALALTYDAWPDLVISDILMPKLDGFSLCHEIKRDVAVRDVPVILLSWKEDLLQRVRELGAAADGYLRKEAAAATVAERLREVLRPRARVEQRVLAGGDARGRLDGLTPRLILELASAAGRDVRVGIRDAVYLYEVQLRGGRLCSATRTSADGHFERGEGVLAALLGVSAGRFLVEPDSSPFRADFEGTPSEILRRPIAAARSSLSAISANALVGVTRVHIPAALLEGYLACTPDPARALLEKIIAGGSPRELITSGEVAPRLLEAVLSDAARRGAIASVERVGSQPAPPRGSEPSEPALRAAPVVASNPVETTAADAGWFSFQLESAVPAPVSAPAPAEPLPSESSPIREEVSSPPPGVQLAERLAFSSEVTPAIDRPEVTASAKLGSETLAGVGALPAVGGGAAAAEQASQPNFPEPALAPAPEDAVIIGQAEPSAAAALPSEDTAQGERISEADDALASVLTQETPEPTGDFAALAESAAPVTPRSGEPSARIVPAQADGSTSRADPVTKRASAGGWLLKMLLAFVVAYCAVRYFRDDVTNAFSTSAPSPVPASSR